MGKRITINPITRLEGHGKIDIFLNEAGDVENAYLQIPELRGFEKFCQGRPAEEMPRITTRLCGVCPWAHHFASAKCLDDLYKVELTPAAKKLRELTYSIYNFYDKILNFYYLASPDFVVGPDAPPEKRNILGVIDKVGMEVTGSVIKHYRMARELLELIGGKAIHPVCGLPGGMSKPITEEQRKDIVEKAKQFIEFASFSLKLFDDVVLKNKKYVELITGDIYYMKTYYMGLVDENNKVNFYDGNIRVVDEDGVEFAKFKPQDYLEHVSEHVEEWTYLKFPYLKKVGWKGFVEGKESGIYRVAPLSRLNVADGMATPKAHEAYEKMYDTLGGKPVHHTLAFHWARLIELLYSAERTLELAEDEEVASPDVRTIPTNTPKEGIGVIEAPRGTLFHHYITDENGIILKVNLIVATGNNHAAICMSIKKAAQKLIKGGKVSDDILNMVEMAFRPYDPCMACATHSIPGQMPIEVRIYDSNKELIQRIKR
jgi:F420-non-reducing hydrogenase large subunit